MNHRHQVVEPLGDFVTIRPLDGSKYAVDIVAKCAEQNPDHSFHIYGEGSYFKQCPPPANLVHFDRFVKQEEMAELLDRYKGALMPSRTDSHGVTMCEMAVTGIPLLVSDTEVSREVLAGFPNVEFIDNEKPSFEADTFLCRRTLKMEDTLPATYEEENTVGAELKHFLQLASQHRRTSS